VNNNPQVCESSIDPIVSYVTSNEVHCSGCMVPIIPQPKKQPMEQKLCETLCYSSVRSNRKKKGFIHLSRENYCFRDCNFLTPLFWIIIMFVDVKVQEYHYTKFPHIFYHNYIGNCDTP
jgi:hypothetical protein